MPDLEIGLGDSGEPSGHPLDALPMTLGHVPHMGDGSGENRPARHGTRPGRDRLLRRSASECGRLCHGDGGHEEGACRRRENMILDLGQGVRLPIVVGRVTGMTRSVADLVQTEVIGSTCPGAQTWRSSGRQSVPDKAAPGDTQRRRHTPALPSRAGWPRGGDASAHARPE
jgi:hypothetical protein